MVIDDAIHIGMFDGHAGATTSTFLQVNHDVGALLRYALPQITDRACRGFWTLMMDSALGKCICTGKPAHLDLRADG